MRHGRTLFAATIAVTMVLAGCQPKKSDAPANGGDLLGTTTGTVAGVKWTVPKRWASQPERPMRVATYLLPAAAGEEAPAECVVSFFGSGQGGPVEMNIDRWKGQFENPEEVAKNSTELKGLAVSTVEIVGTYLSPGGPMMQSTGKRENTRLLGAIITAPEGMVFFKLTGPSKTVEESRKEFHAMVNSLNK
jgi:hypothetical protein